MAVDRNAMVTLRKKGKSNSVIARNLQIYHQTVWNVVKKFKETGETCYQLGQGWK
jgi:transposase